MFHSSIKKRRLQNTIYAIKDMQGNLLDKPTKVADAFLQFYQKLLGTSISQRDAMMLKIVNRGPVMAEVQRKRLIGPFIKDDIKHSMFSIHRDKTPSPDGFGSYYYRDNWEIVGDQICEAMLSSFESGKLLKEVNSTFISLIPKVTCPTDVSEFRPIACCNTIYKCITKLLCVRLKEVLLELIAENKGTFVHGRYIVHNIMVCQDLVRKYGRKNTTPSYMIKLDLRKAYDTVEWGFVEEMLKGIHFPQKFITWVMECITTPQFSLVLNGIPHDYFKSKRGLRQGDPLSPGMEYLSRIMYGLREDKDFSWHPKCKSMKLSHLCFADDMILCCKVETTSIKKMLQCFHRFSQTFGLKANNTKTELYACGMQEEEVQQILQESGFKRGKLPFKYLGVPICSKRISISQCESLVEKMTARIRLWSSRNLSFAGRSQLINSVLLSIHQY
ncbi:LINE-1 retrotransposable element ORF2 protein [Bienertia sinuspersici]